jgi:hypothetical protein
VTDSLINSNESTVNGGEGDLRIEPAGSGVVALLGVVVSGDSEVALLSPLGTPRVSDSPVPVGGPGVGVGVLVVADQVDGVGDSGGALGIDDDATAVVLEDGGVEADTKGTLLKSLLHGGGLEGGHSVDLTDQSVGLDLVLSAGSVVVGDVRVLLLED